MTVIIIQSSDVHIVASVKVSEGAAAEIFCLDTKTGITYTEQLSAIKFVPRVRKTNKRVYMSETVIRSAIAGAQPVEAKLSVANVHDDSSGSESNSEVGDAQKESEERTVLTLKYHVGEARTVLNWQWHLSVINVETFYQALLKDTLHAASYLSDTVDELVDVIKKKDIEIKQYRLEGAKLRRTTVATEHFDETAHQVKHKGIMNEVSNYAEVGRALNGIGEEMIVKEEAPAEEVKPMANVSPQVDKFKETSKRSRKRKALESKTKHVELKAKQRREKPKMQYKDSESQESDLNLILKFDDDDLDEDVKPKLNSKSLVSIPPKAELQEVEVKTGTGEDDDISDIMAMINSTVKQSAKVFSHNSNNN
ncbi:hypothetical protein KR215_010355 [Drosophila sulfurigaster]|nr:hypothetical protein KR215_010355 [Drosophila sulfurigaster]